MWVRLQPEAGFSPAEFGSGWDFPAHSSTTGLVHSAEKAECFEMWRAEAKLQPTSSGVRRKRSDWDLSRTYYSSGSYPTGTAESPPTSGFANDSGVTVESVYLRRSVG